MDDLDKYTLDQAKTEIEHTRSWPTNVLAFYAAINAGLVASFVSVREAHAPLTVSAMKWILTIVIAILLFWALFLVRRNHLSYLGYRRIQVQFQKHNDTELRERFLVPDEWFREHRVSLATSWHGWGFYAFLLCLVTTASFVGLWK